MSSTTFTWNCSEVETYVSHTDDNDNTESDVIFKVHYRLKGVDSNSNQSGAAGVVELDVSDLSSFTDFASVTTSDVQTWVESALGSEKVQELKDAIDADIAAIVTPVTQSRIIS
jgi:hypothetical protein